MEDINILIEEIESELASAKSMLFSKMGKVDTERCLKLLAELKSAVPDSIREALVIISNSERIKDESENFAEKIVREAEERATMLISQSELLKKVEDEAKHIRGEALMFNDTIKKNAKEYVDNMFADVEKFLVDTISTIRNNREELRGAILKDSNKHERN